VKKTVILGILFLVVVLALIISSTIGTNRFRCEVCITYAGRSACRTASAQSREQALRTATENACAQIASGVTESNQCESTRPDRVNWLSQ
jgi:hypothetical protein